MLTDATAFLRPSRKRPKIVERLANALEEVKKHESNIIILPLDSGDRNHSCDEENNEELAEPAGEPEVAVEEDESDSD